MKHIVFLKKKPYDSRPSIHFLLVHSCSDKWTLHVVLLNCRQFLEKMLIGAVIALEYHKLCIQILKIKIFMICNNVRQKEFIRWSEIIQHFILLEARQFKNNYHLLASSYCKILMCHCMLWQFFLEILVHAPRNNIITELSKHNKWTTLQGIEGYGIF